MEIRVKVVSTSVCRSDVTAGNGKPCKFHVALTFAICKPLICRIVVESVSEEVTEFQVGDHVLTVFIGECKSCKHCVLGKSNMCQKLGLERKGAMSSDQKTRFLVKGKPVYHYCAVSSFGEYKVVHSGCAVKVGPTVPGCAC